MKNLVPGLEGILVTAAGIWALSSRKCSRKEGLERRQPPKPQLSRRASA